MKESVKTTFTIIGTVIGAGFISGRELVRFFGGRAFLPILFLTAVLFFLYLYLLLKAGRKYRSFTAFLKGNFKKFAPVVQFLFLVCSFVILTAMIAGINAIEPNFSPYISILTAILCFFIAKKGINGVNILNAILVPVILIYVIVSLFIAGNFSFAQNTPNAVMGALFSWLYVSMNMVLSAPVIVDCGGKLAKKGGAVFAAASASVVIVFCIALILSAIAATEGAGERVMPLLFVLKDGKLFMLISFFGIVTTLISSYYPLHIALESVKYKDAARLLLLTAASVCSILGLDKIVEIIYPALGVFGTLFLFSVLLDGKFFHKYDQKIHNTGKRAKDKGSRHNQVKFKHLPTVDD